MTDNTQEINEIIREMRYRVLEDNGLTVNGLTTIEQETKQAILDWHNKQVEEIIGEDEKTHYPAPASWVGEDAAIRNKLRADQRAALDKLEAEL